VVATDNTINLWEIGDIHHPVMTASLPTAMQAELTFSPDDHLLASTTRSIGLKLDESGTSDVHVWDVTNPHNAIDIGTPASPGAVNSLGFSPDGTILLVGGNIGAKGGARLLDPNIDSLTKRLCDAVNSTLTPSQWQQYFPGTSYNPPCS
jgi:WD40 repeat protein